MQLNEPWKEQWPDDGLEQVPACPLCGCIGREVLYEGLGDTSFRVAPGRWVLWSCHGCRSAYLNPRPTAESIHLAYSSYYTHEPANDLFSYSDLSLFRRVRRVLANGYARWRFGARLWPTSRLGPVAAYAVPSLKRVIDQRYRHLPRIPISGRKLLDVGCGNGNFLELAQACGWETAGIDPDPKAVAAARRKGLDVRQGGLEVFSATQNLFDVITLSHVIEHVHEPSDVLSACFNLLAPSGQIWLETPNIDSFGHAGFRQDWRGLEVPRHLVLFNYRSLKNALAHAGFVDVRHVIRPSPYKGICRESYAIRSQQSAREITRLPLSLRLKCWVVPRMEALIVHRHEFLTMIARKPSVKQ